MSNSLQLHESQHARSLCPSPTPGVHSNSCLSIQLINFYWSIVALQCCVIFCCTATWISYESEIESCSVVSNSLWPNGLYSPWNSPGQNTGVGSHSLLHGIMPTQGLNPGLPHCRQISLPAEPPGKPKNTGVGSLSLLQGLFLTQELNLSLLHCRQILFRLNHQGSYKW